jgi:hypothetical protein
LGLQQQHPEFKNEPVNYPKKNKKKNRIIQRKGSEALAQTKDLELATALFCNMNNPVTRVTCMILNKSACKIRCEKFSMLVISLKPKLQERERMYSAESKIQLTMLRKCEKLQKTFQEKYTYR